MIPLLRVVPIFNPIQLGAVSTRLVNGLYDNTTAAIEIVNDVEWFLIAS